ncbi:MAG: pentapeptide repeat-containing protein [Nocardioides sp.]
MSAPQTPSLVADCDRCFALCCVLLPFAAVSGFGIDKPGGTPCPNLADDDRCRIHATLREDGWTGCATFDCFGAGQQVSQVTYAGVSWREQDNLGEMAAVLSVMRMLHEMLAHLVEVGRRSPDSDADDLQDEVVALTGATPTELLGLDIDDLRERVGDALAAASARLRRGASYHRADLAGRDLRPSDLRDADLRGAVLIAADLRGQDLGCADLLGADVRDADLRGAALADALFLSQAQVNSARGDARTTLPEAVSRPSHWA